MSRVVVFDYGSGNVRSAVRALEHVGAEVELTGDRATALAADGLFVPGVGNFHACMAGLRAADGPAVIDLRLSGGRPVLGVCVGMQVLFDGSDEPSGVTAGGPGGVARRRCPGCRPRWCPTWAGPTSTVAAGLHALRGRRVRAVLLRPLVCRAGLDAGGAQPAPSPPSPPR